MSNQAPNCYKCQFFYTTWERSAPNGCNKFGFKTKRLPSQEVLASSGEQCVFFWPTPAHAASYAPEPPPEPTRDGSTFTAMG